MPRRPGKSGLCALALALLFGTAPAAAQLLPPGFFDAVPPAVGGQAAVEADFLAYDGATDVITASGEVMMRYQGYEVRGERLVYNQRTGELRVSGGAAIRNPAGTVYRAEDIAVTGEFRNATIRALTMITADGAMVTAGSAEHRGEVETILNDATYSPCGLCIDEKGRRIGWRVKAAKLTRRTEEGVVVMEQPSLELLGVPVASLPWLSIPDPTQPRRNGFRLPGLGYSPGRGVSLTVPYFLAFGENTDILVTPGLMSRQGFWLGAEWGQRLPGLGEFEVSASGLRQLDPGAFAGTVGERDWRGAIRSGGRFTPVESWEAGWSYTAFSDAAYLKDYDLDESDLIVNEAYVTHLSPDAFADVRVQQFRQMGNIIDAEQARQATTLPNARFETVTGLGHDMGRLEVRGRLVNVLREDDHVVGTDGGVDHVLGLGGQKTHLDLQAGWQKQIIGPAGVLFTPYLGVRADAAFYDGDSALPASPPDQGLLSATPIAAMDVRWPLVAHAGAASFLLEPIAQLVWRGRDTSLVGITNDNAQSFVLDDTNLFSYDRFSGSDRQETGLRANLGGRMQADLGNGGWVELMAGQSFLLAGANAFVAPDPSLATVGSGLESSASFVVLGAKGGMGPISGGAKVQIDPEGPRVARAAATATFTQDRWSLGGDYLYIPADADTGVTRDQHEIVGRVGIPIADYWRVNAALGWDVASNQWLETRAGVIYDDGYLVYGITGKATPTAVEAGLVFRLRGPSSDYAF